MLGHDCPSKAGLRYWVLEFWLRIDEIVWVLGVSCLGGHCYVLLPSMLLLQTMRGSGMLALKVSVGQEQIATECGMLKLCYVWMGIV